MSKIGSVALCEIEFNNLRQYHMDQTLDAICYNNISFFEKNGDPYTLYVLIGLLSQPACDIIERSGYDTRHEENLLPISETIQQNPYFMKHAFIATFRSCVEIYLTANYDTNLYKYYMDIYNGDFHAVINDHILPLLVDYEHDLHYLTIEIAGLLKTCVKNKALVALEALLETYPTLSESTNYSDYWSRSISRFGIVGALYDQSFLFNSGDIDYDAAIRHAGTITKLFAILEKYHANVYIDSEEGVFNMLRLHVLDIYARAGIPPQIMLRLYRDGDRAAIIALNRNISRCITLYIAAIGNKHNIGERFRDIKADLDIRTILADNNMLDIVLQLCDEFNQTALQLQLL